MERRQITDLQLDGAGELLLSCTRRGLLAVHDVLALRHRALGLSNAVAISRYTH